MIWIILNFLTASTVATLVTGEWLHWPGVLLTIWMLPSAAKRLLG